MGKAQDRKLNESNVSKTLSQLNDFRKSLNKMYEWQKD